MKTKKPKIYSMSCDKPVVHNTHSKSSVSLTKQSFKDECDINSILSRYEIGGVLPSPQTRAPKYGDFSNVDFQNSANVIAEFRSNWENLSPADQSSFSSFDDYTNQMLSDSDEQEESISEVKTEEKPASNDDVGSKDQLST